MKLKDLECILYSSRGSAQFAIIYSQDECKDLENGCLIDYAVKKYGEKDVRHIEAFDCQLVITI